MTDTVAQIVALNGYARNGVHLHESWGTLEFRATYRAALQACKDEVDHHIGVDISWAPETPRVMYVRRTGLISERVEFRRDLPVEGELAAAFLSDLQKLAVEEAVKRIKAEQDESLLREAAQRVTQVMLAAPAVNTASA